MSGATPGDAGACDEGAAAHAEAKKRLKKTGAGGKQAGGGPGGQPGCKGRGGGGQQLVDKWPVNQSWNAFQAAHRGRQMTPQDWKSAKAALAAAAAAAPAPVPAASLVATCPAPHAAAAGGGGTGGAGAGAGPGGASTLPVDGTKAGLAGLATADTIDDFFCAASAAE